MLFYLWERSKLNDRLKGTLRILTPPILWDLVSRFVWRFRGRQRVKPRQRSAEWYDTYYSEFQGTLRDYVGSEYYFLYAVVADRLLRTGIQSALEIGCGKGRLAALLRDKGFRNYVGFDFSKEQIIVAKEMCPEFEFFVADALETDLYTTRQYDSVICTEFLEHVEDDIEVLKKIRSGARFYGSVPNFSFESHIRHFKAKADVEARYGFLFKEFRVDPFLLKRPKATIYVFEGIRL